ncbi:lichenan permease IIC component [Clostridium puniceum]|uniref:Permease IIC component n=1 Tax=Clostridium puniceum TaxID=29367 RepID=A0A1S8TBF1_9CLOT|nr:PTS transporter subunit EIIC [Clostridium puniceum]OOM74944.1 lichenan permease IIC component [Clostridium puniceum]
MESIKLFFQQKFMPALIKLGELKYLIALRDGMVVTVPFTIFGSIFMIIGNMPFQGWYDFIAPISPYIQVPVNVTFGLLGFIVCLSLAYQMSKINKIDIITGVAITSICYIIAMLNKEFKIDPSAYGSGGIFTAIVVAIITSELMHFIIKRNIVIKMPDGVPPAVATSFAALIPGSAALALFWALRVLLGLDINQLITSLFSPLVGGLSTCPGMLFMTFLTLLLWVFGIHGNNVVSGIASPIYLTFLTANIAAVSQGVTPPYITAEGFLLFGMNIGGTGAILGIAISMLTAKSERYKAVSKVGIIPSIFGISEPIMFGFPIVLNPTLAIPFIAVPLVLQGITYYLMKFNIIGRVIAQVPWTTPPVISGFLITGGDWRAALWQLIELIIAILVYLPFFKVLDRSALTEEKDLEEVK